MGLKAPWMLTSIEITWAAGGFVAFLGNKAKSIIYDKLRKYPEFPPAVSTVISFSSN